MVNFLTSARGFSSVIFVALLARSPAHAASAASHGAQSADVQATQACVADPTAPILLYGSLPATDMVVTETSFVQIFPASDTTTAYLQLLQNNVNGIPPAVPAGAADNPSYLSDVVAQARSFVKMPQIARRAPILQFICRGFTPGTYELFATVYALGTTSHGGSGKSFVTLYYRSTVTAPATHKSKLLVGVPAFRLVGQTPK